MKNLSKPQICAQVESLQTVSFIVEDLLLAVAFRNSLCGTNYLRDAIALCCSMDKDKVNFCEDVYPVVAKMHKTTSSRVNKGIRHAIIVCFESGYLKRLNDIFHCPIVSVGYPPTNAELISTVARLLRRLIYTDEQGDLQVKKTSFYGFVK